MAVCSLACEGLSNANATPDQANRKLYIGGLSPETTNEMLLNFFSRHGEIEEGSVAYDKETNKSRYYSHSLSLFSNKLLSTTIVIVVPYLYSFCIKK